MSILDKHPAPWRAERTCIADSGGGLVWADSLEWRLRFHSPEIERLVLAAPELLAALKLMAEQMGADDTEAGQQALALIERIEKG